MSFTYLQHNLQLQVMQVKFLRDWNEPGLFGVSKRVCASAFQPSATAAVRIVWKHRHFEMHYYGSHFSLLTKFYDFFSISCFHFYHLKIINNICLWNSLSFPVFCVIFPDFSSLFSLTFSWLRNAFPFSRFSSPSGNSDYINNKNVSQWSWQHVVKLLLLSSRYVVEYYTTLLLTTLKKTEMYNYIWCI